MRIWFQVPGGEIGRMAFVVLRPRFVFKFGALYSPAFTFRMRGIILEMDDLLATYLQYNSRSEPEIIVAFVQDYFQSIILEALQDFNCS